MEVMKIVEKNREKKFGFNPMHSFETINWTGPTPISQALGYDLAGNITSLEREGGVASTIAYNAVDELVSSTGAHSRAYTYDLLGNRLQDSVNGAGSFTSNFLVANGVSAFLSDPDGFGETVRETTGSVVKNFGYRADGLLNAYQSGLTQAGYYFDALNRRVAKQINVGGGPFYQSYVHLDKEDRIFLGKAGDGAITTYIDGQNTDEHFAEIKGGVGKGYVTDHLGSVLNGEAAGASKSFGLFGDRLAPANLAISSTSSPVMYGFTGREYEAESSLNYHRARLYSPATGRWLSQEPMGEDGPNLYWYVRNSPLRYTDSNGLFPQNIDEAAECLFGSYDYNLDFLAGNIRQNEEAIAKLEKEIQNCGDGVEKKKLKAKIDWLKQVNASLSDELAKLKAKCSNFPTGILPR